MKTLIVTAVSILMYLWGVNSYSAKGDVGINLCNTDDNAVLEYSSDLGTRHSVSPRSCVPFIFTGKELEFWFKNCEMSSKFKLKYTKEQLFRHSREGTNVTIDASIYKGPYLSLDKQHKIYQRARINQGGRGEQYGFCTYEEK